MTGYLDLPVGADKSGQVLVDVTGIEPVTPCLQSKSAASISSFSSLSF
jgi:hypothetical protein